MKKTLLFLLCGLFCFSCKTTQEKAISQQINNVPSKVTVQKPTINQASNINMDSLSYSVGIMIAQGMKSQGLNELNAQDLASGLDDVLKGNDLKIDENTAKQIFQSHVMQLQAKEQAMAAKKHEGNIAAGKAFLTTNGQRSEVTTLPSGLQYEVLNAGTGAIPAANDKVTVHYHGTLIDGTVFDSSVERKEPASFPVGGVIKGWVEALQLMKTGSKWRLFIPSDLAYGERGAGPVIKPYSTLIFDVELLSIDK